MNDNFFYDLPKELIKEVYEYDKTYRELYFFCMVELRAIYTNSLKRKKEFVPSRVIGRRVISHC